MLQPVRDHFKNDPKAKELLKTVKVWDASSSACVTIYLFSHSNNLSRSSNFLAVFDSFNTFTNLSA